MQNTGRPTGFAVFIVIALFFVGGLRVGMHVKAAVQSALLGDAADPLALSSCEAVFCHGNASASGNECAPVSDGASSAISKCQAMAETERRIRDDFIVAKVLLWAVGAAIGGATLLVAFMLLGRRRALFARRLMKALFVAQLLAALGEISVAADRTAQMERFWLAQWPMMDTLPEGDLFINGEFYVTVGISLVVSLIYFGLFMLVRSRRMTSSRPSSSAVVPRH